MSVARNVMAAIADADNEGMDSLVRNDGKNAAEIAAMKKRLENWSNLQSLNKAKGKTRKQIHDQYDNTLHPIAYLPEQYLKEFAGKPPTDNRIYCGEAYFLNHAVNRHPEIKPDDYRKLHEILTSPDEVIIDRRVDNKSRRPRDNLIFAKKYGRINLMAVISSHDGRMLLHKSLYGREKTPYPDLLRVRGMSSGGGLTPIGSAANAAPGGRLSARDDNISIGNKNDSVKSTRTN